MPSVRHWKGRPCSVARSAPGGLDLRQDRTAGAPEVLARAFLSSAPKFASGKAVSQAEPAPTVEAEEECARAGPERWVVRQGGEGRV